jgi:hypothetical protein
VARDSIGAAERVNPIVIVVAVELIVEVRRPDIFDRYETVASFPGRSTSREIDVDPERKREYGHVASCCSLDNVVPVEGLKRVVAIVANKRVVEVGTNDDVHLAKGVFAFSGCSAVL